MHDAATEHGLVLATKRGRPNGHLSFFVNEAFGSFFVNDTFGEAAYTTIPPVTCQNGQKKKEMASNITQILREMVAAKNGLRTF